MHSKGGIYAGSIDFLALLVQSPDGGTHALHRSRTALSHQRKQQFLTQWRSFICCTNVLHHDIAVLSVQGFHSNCML